MFDWDPTPRIEVQYAKRIDCELNGCDPPHSDNGTILPFIGENGRATHDLDEIRGMSDRRRYYVNNHRCALVSRVVTYTGWRES